MTVYTCDVAVVGGGPAGLAAATTAASGGASTLMIDENEALGGHFYKELPSAFPSEVAKRRGKKNEEFRLRREALACSGVTVLQGTRVWGVFAGTGTTFSGQDAPDNSSFSLYLELQEGGSTSVEARTLILAPGVYDRSLPFAGWELPGVLTPGAVQMLLEKQGLLPGQRVLVAGSGPLQLVVAAALAREGAKVVAVLDMAGAMDGLGGLPRVLGGLWGRLQEGISCVSTLGKRGVPILFRHAVFRAIGTPQDGIRGAVIGRVDAEGRPIPGTQRELEVDAICCAYGFLPSIALTLHLGCNHDYNPDLCAYIPRHDERMQTSLPGVFVAGDVTGVGGKPLADLQGQIAGFSALEWLGRLSPQAAYQRRSGLEGAVRREQRFSRWLWQRYRIRPGLLELADDETLLCRCEAVRVGQVRESMRRGGQDLFGVKLRTRLGMGQCQGRYCIPNAILLIAAQMGLPVPQLGTQSIRPPIVPVRLKDIAALEQSPYIGEHLGD